MARDRVDRAQMRGLPLDADCYRACVSIHEYTTETRDYTGCYGLVSESDTPLDKCLKCGAYALGDFCGRVRELESEEAASNLSKYGFEGFDERRESVLRKLNDVADIVWDLYQNQNTCRPVTWGQHDGTTVYKCPNVDGSIVTYDSERFAYCPLCGGRIEVE